MIRRLVPLALALALGACNTSANYFEDEDDSAYDRTNTLGSLLTMSGMVAETKRPIEYGPRAPLVISKTTDLPAPQDRSAARDAVNFPVDQDVQEAAAIERVREGGRELDDRLFRDNTSARARPGAIQATVPASGASTRTEDIRDIHGNVSERDRLSREELATVFKNPNRAALLNEDGTPAPRANLAVPPSDYRTPAQTAALPDADDVENSDFIRKRLYQKDDRRPARLQNQPSSSVLQQVLR